METVAPAPTGERTIGHFEQYQAAIEWAEQDGAPVPFALSVSYGEESLNPNGSYADFGWDGWARFEQYMAAIER